MLERDGFAGRHGRCYPARMHRILAGILPLLLVPPATTACGFSCDTMYKTVPITIARDMTVPISEVGDLTVEACYGFAPKSRCANARVVAGELQTIGPGGLPVPGTDAQQLLVGKVFALPGGGSRIEATMYVDETSNPVVFQVKNPKGAVVASALGYLDWSSDACHPMPSRTSI